VEYHVFGYIGDYNNIGTAGQHTGSSYGDGDFPDLHDFSALIASCRNHCSRPTNRHFRNWRSTQGEHFLG
jgi:hypothetical protein